MNKYIWMILFTILLSNKISFSQELTSIEKQEIIAELDSSDFWMRSGALEQIKEYKIVEATPKLLEKIWAEASNGLGFSYLLTLHCVYYPNFVEIAHAFIDSADNFNYQYSSSNPLIMKMMATSLLFKVGDFSTKNYLFESIEADTLNKDAVFHIRMLADLALNVPEYKDYSITELLKFVTQEKETYLSDNDKFDALYFLQKISDSNIIDLAQDIIQYKPDFSLKALSLKILEEKKFDNLEVFIKERIVSDTSNSFKLLLVSTLTNNFSDPSTYIFLNERMNLENDPTLKQFMNIRLEKFLPVISDSNITILIMLDTLSSYTNQCYDYEWLKDETYKNELLTKLTNAKNYLNAGDSLNCKTEVTAFQNSVDMVYQNAEENYPKYVSDEGYKFLYYYSGYIIEKL